MFKLRVIGDLGFEFWQDIPGYEGLYKVSIYGNVKSIKRQVRGKSNSLHYLPEKELVQVIIRQYLSVGLHKDGIVKTHPVHRLVAEVFIPKFNLNFKCVNHKSEVKTENQVWNLEWCTYEYNNNYGTRLSRAIKSLINNPKRSKEVAQYDISGNKVAVYCSASEAARINGCDQGNISNCCRGRQKSAYGYIWKYNN